MIERVECIKETFTHEQIHFFWFLQVERFDPVFKDVSVCV